MTGPPPARYHLLLTIAGRPVMHGWWADEKVARGRFTVWIGERGSLPDARVTLLDEEAGETLTDWPGVVGGAS
jgi:hypothetical protein